MLFEYFFISSFEEIYYVVLLFIIVCITMRIIKILIYILDININFAHFNIFFISSFGGKFITFVLLFIIAIHGPCGGNICNAPCHRGKKLEEVRSTRRSSQDRTNCPEKTCNKLHTKRDLLTSIHSLIMKLNNIV